MAARCFYFVEDNKIIEQWVDISWNEGFTKEAKQSYIRQAEELALDKYQIVIQDVTTASPNERARMLSPYFVKCSPTETVEEAWPKFKKAAGRFVPGLFDFVYLSCILRDEYEYILSIDGFIDIFHNPEKKMNTQAKSLCVLQLLLKNNKTELFNDIDSFVTWYRTIEIEVRY